MPRIPPARLFVRIGRHRDGGYEYTLQDGPTPCQGWRRGSRTQVLAYLHKLQTLYTLRATQVANYMIIGGD